ncbi:MAG: sigma-70 factor domain-containing protein, partial [Solirubrobacteraceae bacterium]
MGAEDAPRKVEELFGMLAGDTAGTLRDARIGAEQENGAGDADAGGRFARSAPGTERDDEDGAASGRSENGSEGPKARAEPSEDALRHYLNTIGRVPLLSAAEEVCLAKRIERG